MRRFLISLSYAWNWKKPLAMIRIARSFLRSVFSKQPVLRYVDMSIGYRCNLKCAHCFAHEDREKFNEQKRMSPSFFHRCVVVPSMEMGAVNFSFQGGEPLLYPDLPEYIKAADPKRNIISVTTNATLLTEDKARELKSWGVDILTVSVDRYHDRIRLHEIVLMARSAGLKVTLGTVLTHDIFEDEAQLKKLGELAGYCQDNGLILLMIFAVAMGRWSGNEKALLTEDDVRAVHYIEKLVPYARTDFQANYYHRGCGAGKEILFIKPSGEVFPCPFLDIPFGNVRHESLKLIRQRMTENKILDHYSTQCLAAEEGGIWKRCL